MGYDGYNDGGVWMWVFDGLMILGVLVLIGLAVWAVVTVTNRANRGTTTPEHQRPDPDQARCWTSGTPAAN